MKETLFHKILAGDIPCHKIYEDHSTFVFLDIRPATKGHMLVIPKKSSKNIYDVNNKDLEKLIKTCKKMAGLAKEKLGCDGCNIIQSSGQAAEQEVKYFHFHVIPRYEKDNFRVWSNRQGDEDMLKQVKKELTS